MAQISDSLENEKNLLLELQRKEVQLVSQDEKADGESIQLQKLIKEHVGDANS